MSLIRNIISNWKSSPKGEMTFVDHVEDLRWHLIRALLSIVIMAIIVFIKIEWVFNNIILGPANNDFVSYKWFCWLGKTFHMDSLCLGDVNVAFQNTALAGQFVLSLSVSLSIGFILSFPYILWELWRFVRPALKPNEVQYAHGLVFWCSVLFFSGVLFAYYIVAPYTVNFFGSYQLSPKFKNIITIDNYYDTMSDLVLGMGIVFELPILIYFLSRIGILTPKLMTTKRRYAIIILVILAEVITPPDAFSWILVFIPLYALYEMSVLISMRALKERQRKQAERDKI